MPETRVERVLFALGVAIIGVLVAVIVLGRHPSERAASATPTTARNRTVSVTSTSLQSTNGNTTTPRTTTTAAPPPETGSEARLQVTATADTWLSVRRETATGDILFEGTLASGDSRSFAGTKFAVRFGAAANVRARLDDKPLPLPSGTYSTTITPAGLGPRSA